MFYGHTFGGAIFMKDRIKNYNKEIKSDKIDHNNIYDIINKNNRKNRKESYGDYDNETSAEDYNAYEEYEDYNEYEDYDEYDEDGYEYDKRYDEDDYEGYYEEDEYYESDGRNGYSPYKTRMKGKKKSYMKKFFGIVFSILFVYIAVFGGFIAYTYFDDDPENDYFGKGDIMENISRAIGSEKEVPKKITVLLTGVDEDYSRDGTRTDTIMTACVDFENKKLSFISIPRDTGVEVPEDRFSVMQENYPDLKSNMVKINSVYLYGGEKGMEFLKKQVEELLGVEIDYYAKINFKGFVKLIDSIGGVKFNVEQRCYYNDKAGFVVDLKPGEQVLDGEKAIQLVRFRSGYKRADLKRIEVQRDFLKAFLNQALKKESIMSNPKQYIDTIIEYVDTDITMGDLSSYLNAIEGFDAENIKGYTLPGESEYRGGISYYNFDSEEIKKMIDEIYNNKTQEPETADVKPTEEDSKDKRIIVLNGGKTTGLAKKASENLKEKGFNIISYDNAKGTYQNTRIYVKKDGQGKDLSEFFTLSEIVVDEGQCTDKNCDILIVLGENEKLANMTKTE